MPSAHRPADAGPGRAAELAQRGHLQPPVADLAAEPQRDRAEVVERVREPEHRLAHPAAPRGGRGPAARASAHPAGRGRCALPKQRLGVGGGVPAGRPLPGGQPGPRGPPVVAGRLRVPGHRLRVVGEQVGGARRGRPAGSARPSCRRGPPGRGRWRTRRPARRPRSAASRAAARTGGSPRRPRSPSRPPTVGGRERRRRARRRPATAPRPAARPGRPGPARCRAATRGRPVLAGREAAQGLHHEERVPAGPPVDLRRRAPPGRPPGERGRWRGCRAGPSGDPVGHRRRGWPAPAGPPRCGRSRSIEQPRRRRRAGPGSAAARRWPRRRAGGRRAAGAPGARRESRRRKTVTASYAAGGARRRGCPARPAARRARWPPRGRGRRAPRRGRPPPRAGRSARRPDDQPGRAPRRPAGGTASARRRSSGRPRRCRWSRGRAGPASSARRVLPMPASPVTRTTAGRPATASCQARSSSAVSSLRPARCAAGGAGARRRRHRRGAAQDRDVQVAGRGRRVDAELLGEHGAQPLVRPRGPGPARPGGRGRA